MAVIKIYLSEDGENYVSKFPNSTKEFSSICEKGHYQIPLGWSFGGTHKTNTFQCRLSGSPYYINEFEKYKHIKVTKDGNVVFLGSNPTFKKTIEKSDYYEVTATYEDYSRKFSDVLFSSDPTWEKMVLTADGWTVCNPSDTSHSLVHYLFSRLNTDSTFTLHCTHTDSTPVSYAYFKYNNRVLDAWDKCLKQNALAYYVVNRDVYVFDILEQISGTATTIPNIESEATINEKPYVDHTLPAIRRPVLIQSGETRVYDSGTITVNDGGLISGGTVYNGTMQAGAVKVGDNQEVKAMRNLTWHFSGSHSNNPKFRVQTGAPYEDTFFGIKTIITPYSDYYTGSASGSAYDETLKFILVNDNIAFDRSATVWMTANADILDYNALTKPFNEAEWNGKEEKCEFIYVSTNADIPEQNALRYLNALRYASTMEAKKYNFYSDLDLALNTVCVIQNVTTADEIAHHEYIRITDKVDNLDDFGGYTYTGVPYVSEQVVADNFFNPVVFDEKSISKAFDFSANRTTVYIDHQGAIEQDQDITFTISLREYYAVPTLTVDGVAQTLVRRTNTETSGGTSVTEYLNIWDCVYTPVTYTGLTINAVADLDGEKRSVTIGILESPEVNVPVSSYTEYYLSTSNESATGGEWLSYIPQLISGRYLWRRVTTVYTDGTEAVGEPSLLLTVNDAQQTFTVTSKQQYCLVNEQVQQLDGTETWSDTAPSGWYLGKKYWTRIFDTISYADGHVETNEGTANQYYELNSALERGVSFSANINTSTYNRNLRSVNATPTNVSFEAESNGLETPVYHWTRNGVQFATGATATDTIASNTSGSVVYGCYVTHKRGSQTSATYYDQKTFYVQPVEISTTPQLITPNNSSYFATPSALPSSPYQIDVGNSIYLIQGDYAVVQKGNPNTPNDVAPSPWIYTGNPNNYNGWEYAGNDDQLTLKTLSIGLGLSEETVSKLGAYVGIFEKIIAVKGVFRDLEVAKASVTDSIVTPVLTTVNSDLDGGTREGVLATDKYFQLAEAVSAIRNEITDNTIGTLASNGSFVATSASGESTPNITTIKKYFFRTFAGSTRYWREDEAVTALATLFTIPSNAFPSSPIGGTYNGTAYTDIIKIDDVTARSATRTLISASSITDNTPSTATIPVNASVSLAGTAISKSYTDPYYPSVFSTSMTSTLQYKVNNGSWATLSTPVSLVRNDVLSMRQEIDSDKTIGTIDGYTESTYSGMPNYYCPVRSYASNGSTVIAIFDGIGYSPVQSYLVYSTDGGVTWNTGIKASDLGHNYDNWLNTCYGGGYFYATLSEYGNRSIYLYRSSNGINWTRISTICTYSANGYQSAAETVCRFLSYGNGELRTGASGIITGIAELVNKSFYSTDGGATWNTDTTDGKYRCGKPAYMNNRWVWPSQSNGLYVNDTYNRLNYCNTSFYDPEKGVLVRITTTSNLTSSTSSRREFNVMTTSDGVNWSIKVFHDDNAYYSQLPYTFSKCNGYYIFGCYSTVDGYSRVRQYAIKDDLSSIAETYTFPTAFSKACNEVGCFNGRMVIFGEKVYYGNYYKTIPASAFTISSAGTLSATYNLSAYSVGYNLVNAGNTSIAVLPTTATWQDFIFYARQGNTELSLPSSVPSTMTNSYYMSKSTYGLNLFDNTDALLAVLSPSEKTWYTGTLYLQGIISITSSNTGSLTTAQKFGAINLNGVAQTSINMTGFSQATLKYNKIPDSGDTTPVTVNVQTGINQIFWAGSGNSIQIYTANESYQIKPTDLFVSINNDGGLTFRFTPSMSGNTRPRGLYVDDIFPINNDVSIGTNADRIKSIYAEDVYINGTSLKTLLNL